MSGRALWLGRWLYLRWERDPYIVEWGISLCTNPLTAADLELQVYLGRWMLKVYLTWPWHTA